MVRGRRKTKTVNNKCKVSSEGEDGGNASKSEFQGKLSHNPTSPARITRFFPPQVPKTVSSCQPLSPPAMPIVIGRTSPRRHASTMSVLQQANCVLNSRNEDKTQNSPSPHKIELHSPPPLSSSALHRFTFQCPKKNTKSRKKYPTHPVKPLGSPLSSRSVNNNHKLTEYFPVRRSVRKTKKTVLEEKQKCLQEAVLAKQEDGLEVHMFEGKGRGIVAVQPFYRGQFVVEYAGELITSDEAREREQLYAQDQNTGCYMYYFKHHNVQYCVDATAESDRLGRLVNHSRNGNLTTKTVVIENIPHLVLIAKEDIQPGEEVTYDYGDRSKESLQYHPWLAT
ncbi:histone-lysine N-methyltransferase PR-Set7 isoform X2 [Homalodisca vitripennis]|uniref:histone-lysine N-methyltransferase PR-Set7 isoform X2 n=1 Tax=Homalodisca vitripennis TaxID=197043 RepID=UPI001EEC889C|nr:histone-lysine N-methyltransferase PR-Set7 isoform X2 [Homalodisca vitripennis]